MNLKCFRFRSNNVSKTSEFWNGCMKMHLSTQSDVGSQVRTLFKFPINDVGLRFEYDRLLKHKSRSTISQRVAPPTRPLGPESIVIYVDDLDEYVDRVRAAGFGVYIDIMQITDFARTAIVIDPNGMRVRLLQSNQYPFNRDKSHGFLAYVSIPIKEYGLIDKAVQFYEDVSNSASTNSNTSRRPKLNKQHGFDQKADSKDMPWSSQSIDYFRLVDVERFVEDLQSYVWLGNGHRKKHPCLCLFHKIERKVLEGQTRDAKVRQFEQRMAPQETEFLFLGICLTVLDLETACSNFRRTQLVPLARLYIQSAPGQLRYIAFADPAFLEVEVTDGTLGSFHSSMNRKKNLKLNRGSASHRQNNVAKLMAKIGGLE